MTRTILLADDSITIQKVIGLTFTEEDYRVVAVGDGDAALGRLDELAPDLVIADVNMPGADGYQVAREVKRRRPSTPVLLLVGTFEPFDQAQAESSGAERYIKKPFDSQELQRVVEELLAATPADAATPAVADPPHESAPPAAVPGAAAGFAFSSEPEPPVARVGSAHAAPDGPEEVAWAEPPSTSAADDDGDPLDAGVSIDAGDSIDADEAGFDLDPDAPFGDLTTELPPGVGATEADPAIFDVEPEDFRGTAPAAEPHLPEESFAGGAPTGYTPEPAEPAEPAESAPVADDALGADYAADEAPAADQAPAAYETPAADEAPVADETPVADQTPAEGLGLPPAAGAAEPQAAGQVPAAGLSDDDVERIARRVVELLADQSVREVAWEIVPDVAEIVIKERLRELEAQVE